MAKRTVFTLDLLAILFEGGLGILNPMKILSFMTGYSQAELESESIPEEMYNALTVDCGRRIWCQIEIYNPVLKNLLITNQDAIVTAIKNVCGFTAISHRKQQEAVVSIIGDFFPVTFYLDDNI